MDWFKLKPKIVLCCFYNHVNTKATGWSPEFKWHLIRAGFPFLGVVGGRGYTVLKWTFPFIHPPPLFEIVSAARVINYFQIHLSFCTFWFILL